MEKHEILIKKAQRLREQKAALESTLLSESILDMLISAILGPFIQTSANKFKNTSEYKKLIAKIKQLDKEAEKTSTAAQEAYEDYIEKYAPELLKQGTKLPFSRNTKKKFSTKPL